MPVKDLGDEAAAIFVEKVAKSKLESQIGRLLQLILNCLLKVSSSRQVTGFLR